MKFCACDNLIHGLNFFGNSVRLCNTIYIGTKLIHEQEIKKLTPTKIIKARKELFERLKKGEIPCECQGCPYLEEKEWDLSAKIDTIHVFHWIHCNCGCIYCANKYYTKGKFSDEVLPAENYRLYPILKNLYEKNLISKDNLTVHFGGGELSVLDEADDLINLFLDNNVKEMRLMSSCITYSQAVSKAMQKGHPLVFALSCGTKEVFAKIKRRDLFDRTVANIRRYQQEAGAFKSNTVSRYIIFDRFNNTKEEIENWLNLSKDLGVGFIDLSLDFCGSLENKRGQKIPTEMYALFDFAREKCKELNLDFNIEQFSSQMLERGVY